MGTSRGSWRGRGTLTIGTIKRKIVERMRATGDATDAWPENVRAGSDVGPRSPAARAPEEPRRARGG